WRAGDPVVIGAMQRWAELAQLGRAALLQRDYSALNRLIDENFDLRARLYPISTGNLEMIQAARRAGASANFAGSGGAITGAYQDEAMFQRLVDEMKPYQVAVIKPKIVAAKK
ncbi:MAG: GHMP kinase, partial [Bryobacteraceae bacterium]